MEVIIDAGAVGIVAETQEIIRDVGVRDAEETARLEGARKLIAEMHSKTPKARANHEAANVTPKTTAIEPLLSKRRKKIKINFQRTSLRQLKKFPF